LASSRVIFTNTSGETEFATVEGYSESHTVPLTCLEPDIVYHYRIITQDEAGNETISPDYVFYSGNCALCGFQEEPDPVLINPVIDLSESSGFPAVVYDADHFNQEVGDYIKTEGGTGTDTYQVTPYYKMWYCNEPFASVRNINLAYSEDAITWYHGSTDGLKLFDPAMKAWHPMVIYNKNGWDTITGQSELAGKYMIWVWEGGNNNVIGQYISSDGVTVTRLDGRHEPYVGSTSDLPNTLFSGSSIVYSVFVLYDPLDPNPDYRFKAWADNNGYYYYTHSANLRDWADASSSGEDTRIQLCTDSCVDPKWEGTLTQDLTSGVSTDIYLDRIEDFSYKSRTGYELIINPGQPNEETVSYTRASPADNYLVIDSPATIANDHATGESVVQIPFIFENGACSIQYNENLGVFEVWFSTNVYGRGFVPTWHNHTGIGYARTSNGYQWTPLEYIDGSGQRNPILSTADGLNPNRNPPDPVFNGYTDTPYVIYSPNQFSGHGEYRDYKMWFMGGLTNAESNIFYLSFNGTF